VDLGLVEGWQIQLGSFLREWKFDTKRFLFRRPSPALFHRTSLSMKISAPRACSSWARAAVANAECWFIDDSGCSAPVAQKERRQKFRAESQAAGLPRHLTVHRGGSLSLLSSVIGD
jgi:hypothetical protein